MPTPDDVRARLLASSSDSDEASESSLACGGGAGCRGCEPHLAVRVARIDDDEGDDDDCDGVFDDDDDRDNKNSDTAVFPKPRNANRPVRARVVGRAVLHAGGGFSFRQDKPRRRSSPPTSTSNNANNPFARCFSLLWSVGSGGRNDSDSSSSPSSSYEVAAEDLVGAVGVFRKRGGEETREEGEKQQRQRQQRRRRISTPAAAPFAFSPYSATRGTMPPLRPLSSCSSLPPSTSSTSSRIIDVIRRIASPWDNQLPSDPERPRSALVVVNPTAGGGKALALFDSLLSPMLEAAGVAVAGVVVTGKPGEARDAALSADPSSVGALVAVGGDGTAAELLQGLMSRERQGAARRERPVPLAMLPAGSGNALALGALRSDERDPTIPSSSSSPAAVCAIKAAAAISKGRSAPLDVVVADSTWEEGEGGEEGGTTSCPRFAKDGALLVSRPSRSPSSPSLKIARRFGFLSLTYGLIANADVGTDSWRWMGKARFTLGALREVLAKRSHPLEAFVVDADDRCLPPSPSSTCGSLQTPLLDSLPSSALDMRREPPTLPPPWRRLAAEDAALFAACNLSHLDASTHLAPGARRDCGSMHVVRTKGSVPRLSALKMLVSAESGKHIVDGSSSTSVSSSTAAAAESDKSDKNDASASSAVSVDRVRALLLRPLDATVHGRLALDGEELPRGKAVACEVVPGGARLIVREF